MTDISGGGDIERNTKGEENVAIQRGAGREVCPSRGIESTASVCRGSKLSGEAEVEHM